jgi:hypothetical protein
LATKASLPSDLKIAKELIYDPCGFDLTDPSVNTESAAYGACSFVLNGKRIQHRVSKITPTKVGQFVTIWKRNKEGITQPFDILDEMDFIFVTSRSGDNFGQFIFPKFVLAEKGIITQYGKGGKRGIRVYPPWDTAANRQAKKTQSWQSRYFVPIHTDNSSDLDLMKKLLMSESQ